MNQKNLRHQALIEHFSVPPSCLMFNRNYYYVMSISLKFIHINKIFAIDTRQMNQKLNFATQQDILIVFMIV